MIFIDEPPQTQAARSPLCLAEWVKCTAIGERMAQAGTQNLSAYIRKMALNGYVLNIYLSPVPEPIFLQRRYSSNLNHVAIHANTYGVYSSEITVLQKDYIEL